jgi:hypothetical protein
VEESPHAKKKQQDQQDYKNDIQHDIHLINLRKMHQLSPISEKD